jgi:hypothetical protein
MIAQLVSLFAIVVILLNVLEGSSVVGPEEE